MEESAPKLETIRVVANVPLDILEKIVKKSCHVQPEKRQTMREVPAVFFLSPIMERPTTLVLWTLGTGCGVHSLLMTVDPGLTASAHAPRILVRMEESVQKPRIIRIAANVLRDILESTAKMLQMGGGQRDASRYSRKGRKLSMKKDSQTSMAQEK